MDILVCIGSSCHLKGSRLVIQRLDELIKEKGLEQKLTLKGSFCMGQCANDGIAVKCQDQVYNLKPEGVNEFFENTILTKI